VYEEALAAVEAESIKVSIVSRTWATMNEDA
jgi:hypothetical protein